MNQINLRRFIYKLYQTKEYNVNLINRVEKELSVNLKNKYILENILNFLIKMLRIKIKEGSQFEAINFNKLNEMIKVCLKGLEVKENPKHLICVLNFTESLLKSINPFIKKEDKSLLIDKTRNTENMSNKVLINLYSKLLFNDIKRGENTGINEEILSTIMQYFSKKFLSLFSDLKYKINNLNIEILNRNSYKLHLYFLCFFIKTNKIEKEIKQFIKPLYISYFIIENHLMTEKQLNFSDSNFYELKNRKELIKETLKILFQKTIKNLNLKKIMILKKYNKFMQFLDKNALNETIKNIISFKTVNENVITVYEEILSNLLKNNEKVSKKMFDFLKNKKQTDLILEFKFHYLISFCNEKSRIQNFLIENLFSIKKRVSFNFKTNEIFKEEELLSIFFHAFNKTISSELNKIFLIEKVYFNNKNSIIYVFELLNYRSSLVQLLNSVHNETDIIVLNQYLKHILLHLIYKHEIKDISTGIETYLNPKDILKLNPSKNPQSSVVENFLQILAEIIKHFSKLNKLIKIEIDDSLFNHKVLWENFRTRNLILFIYKLMNKSDILENQILKNLNGNSVTPEALGDLQILGNTVVTDLIFHLLKRNCVCLKNGEHKMWLEVFEWNFLYACGQEETLKRFLKYIAGEEVDVDCGALNNDLSHFFRIHDTPWLEKGDLGVYKKYFEEPRKRHTFLFLLKLNRHLMSRYLTILIQKFPLEKYNNLILQLKAERLILLKDFLKELESKHLQLSLFKKTFQSFEIFFDKKIKLFEYKNLKSLSKTNYLMSKFKSLNLKDFSTENTMINSLKSVLTEEDAEKFIDVIFHSKDDKKNSKIFFGERVYFYFFVLCVLKFECLFKEKREVFSSILFSCEFLDVEIDDFF